MKPIEISIIRSGAAEKAIIECDRNNSTLTLTLQNGVKETYASFDYFECFGLLRSAFPEIKFLCKGAKRNVYTSRMSSQMSRGFVAYEHTIGRTCDNGDLVRIFDYEEKDITNNIEEQREFYRNWIDSLKNLKPPLDEE